MVLRTGKWKTGHIVERNHYHIKRYTGKSEVVGRKYNGRKNKIRTPTSSWSATRDTDRHLQRQFCSSGRTPRSYKWSLLGVEDEKSQV